MSATKSPVSPKTQPMVNTYQITTYEIQSIGYYTNLKSYI